MTLRHLKIFHAVAENESITKTAEKFYVSQPSISVAIQELEKYYGVVLFERLNRRLKITEDGKRLQLYASQILQLFDDLERSFQSPDRGGTLRIGSSVTVGRHHLPDCIMMLRSQYPNINVKVRISSSGEIEDMILNNDLDVAIIEGAVHTEHIIAQKISGDRLVAVCCPDHPFAAFSSVSLDAFLSEPMLLGAKGGGARELVDNALALRSRSVEPFWESSSSSAVLHGVEMGHGVSILPEEMVADAIDDGRLCEITIEDFALNRAFFLIYHKNKFMSEAMKAFIETAHLAFGSSQEF